MHLNRNQQVQVKQRGNDLILTPVPSLRDSLQPVWREAAKNVSGSLSDEQIRAVIYDGLYAILDSTAALRGDHTDEALDLYVTQPKLDYVDCLLRVLAKGKQDNVLTFDKDLAKVLS